MTTPRLYNDVVRSRGPGVLTKATALRVASGNPYREDGTMRFASASGGGTARAEGRRARRRSRRDPSRDAASSLVFASPEQRTGRSLGQAQQDVRTTQQRAFRGAQEAVLTKLRLGRAVTQDALGIWADPTEGIGAEASTATHLPRGIPHEDAVLAAAMMGRLTNQKGVIAYTPDSAGKDLRLTVQGMRGTPDAIYRDFQQAGIENVTLVHQQNTWTAHLIGFHDFVGDTGLTSLVANAHRIGTARGADRISFTTGKATYVGADERADANTEYDTVIRMAASRGATRAGGRHLDQWWPDFLAQWNPRGPGAGVTKRASPRTLTALLDTLGAWRDRWIEDAPVPALLFKDVVTIAVTSGNPYRTEAGSRFASADSGTGVFASDDAFWHARVHEVEPDALIPPAVIRTTDSVFAAMDEDQRQTFRNQAADILVADRALAGTRGPVSRAAITRVLGDVHASLQELTPTDVDSIASSVRAYEKTHAKGTNFRNWAHLDKLRALGMGNDPHADAWYESNQIIHEVFPDAADARVFKLLLAVTSQRNDVSNNTAQALSFYLQYRAAGRQVPDEGFLGGLSAVRDNAASALRTGEVAGSKIGEFVRALNGDPDAVVTDMWMARAFGLKTDLPTPREHRIIQRIVRRKAAELGMRPAALQAAIWRGSAIEDFEEKKGVPFPAERYDPYGAQLLRRARNIFPAFRASTGRGKARVTLPLPPDYELFGMFAQDAKATWTYMGASVYKRKLLADIRDRVRAVSRLHKAARPEAALRLFLAITVLEAGLDERVWRRMVANALGGVPPRAAWAVASRDAEPFLNAGLQFDLAPNPARPVTLFNDLTS